ncbi:MAG TPA: DUF2845 domain-containing protein [Pseudomonadales bacterium]|nr:DUF2845 domain-containing protein [Pseudomonadales bacterium]
MKKRYFLLFFQFILTTLMITPAPSFAKEPDAAERKFISQGMQQGEVVKKIGMPDYQNSYEKIQPCYSVIEGEHRARQVVITQCGQPIKVEVWTYNPAPHDNQTMTVITFENGTVTEIKRDISR